MSKIRLTAAVCMMALVMGVLGPVQMVQAAGCADGRHPSTQARELSSSLPAPAPHTIQIGTLNDGSPLYARCEATVRYITFAYFCTSCGAKVGDNHTYSIESHPNSLCPKH